MAVKQHIVEGIGLVTFQKRRGTKSVRIHIQGPTIRVTMPYWISMNEAAKFVRSREAWIKANRSEKVILADGAYIGKGYQLSIITKEVTKPQTRILRDTIRIVLPPGAVVDTDDVQSTIQKACERALAKEAKELLTSRIADLAYEYGFEYKSLHFKKLKRRWGSCDANQHIILNIFLTQLQWDYIDYVLLHELTHTEHLNHSPAFWAKLSECLPNTHELRKEMREHQPHLLPQ